MANFREALTKKRDISAELPIVNRIRENKETHDSIAKRIGSTSSSIGHIDSQILLDAPYDFFFKYDKVVKETVEEVRDLLVEDGTSDTISQLNLDPENENLRRKATDTIKFKITKINDSPKGERMLASLTGQYDIKIVNAMVLNELIGLGPLEPLWEDGSITEIIANGPHDIQVEIKGTIRTVPSCHFRDADHLMSLINKLYGSINKSLSRTTPALRGRLYDKSRIHAVHTIIAPEGPNFNIRRHNNEFIGPVDLINWGSCSEELMKDIGNYVYGGLPYMVVGGTGTGKTTLLNAMTGFIDPHKRGVILEQNLEMKPHPNKLFAAPMECVDVKSGTSAELGVTMRDLVKAATQMRPECIYIGEVIDDAAYDLCQAGNTGHEIASTFHANTAEDGMYRLMSLVSQSDLVKERAAYDLIASAFAIIIVAKRFKNGDRKIVAVSEIANKAEKDTDGNVYLPVTPLWEFEVDYEKSAETGRTEGEWIKRNELSEEIRRKYYFNTEDELTWQELVDLSSVKEGVDKRAW